MVWGGGWVTWNFWEGIGIILLLVDTIANTIGMLLEIHFKWTDKSFGWKIAYQRKHTYAWWKECTLVKFSIQLKGIARFQKVHCRQSRALTTVNSSVFCPTYSSRLGTILIASITVDTYLPSYSTNLSQKKFITSTCINWHVL